MTYGKRNKSIGSRIFDGINIILFALVIILCILPVWHVICASFSNASWVLNQTGIIWRIEGFNVNGYQLVFQNNSIWSGYANTILYVVASTFIGMLFTVMGAYALSRKNFLWANPIMLGISFTMLFSGGIITSYIVVTQYLHMYDSRWAVIIPTCMNAFYLILIRTAMQNVPDSLVESAMLDGAGQFTILFKIVLPLIKATLATVDPLHDCRQLELLVQCDDLSADPRQIPAAVDSAGDPDYRDRYCFVYWQYRILRRYRGN